MALPIGEAETCVTVKSPSARRSTKSKSRVPTAEARGWASPLADGGLAMSAAAAGGMGGPGAGVRAGAGELPAEVTLDHLVVDVDGREEIVD